MPVCHAPNTPKKKKKKKSEQNEAQNRFIIWYKSWIVKKVIIFHFQKITDKIHLFLFIYFTCAPCRPASLDTQVSPF
jgi:hypothetical protein